MSRHAPVAERLRAYVRDRVRREGRFYQRGVGAALATHLNKPSSWVSEYTDPNPAPGKFRTADLDTALAICDFFGVALDDFAKADVTVGGRPESATTPQAVTRVVRLLGMMSGKGQRFAARMIAGIVPAYPKPEAPVRTQRPSETGAATVRTAREKR